MGAAFCPPSDLMARSDDTIMLFDWTSGQAQSMLAGEFNGTLSMAFSPDGSMLPAAGVSGKVFGWQPFV